MNAEQIRLALLVLGDLISDPERARALHKIARVFEDVGAAKAVKIISTIRSNWESSGRAPRHPAQLKDSIANAHRLFLSSGAKKQADTFAAFLGLFQGTGDQPIDAFVADAIVSRVKSRTARRPSRPKGAFTAEQAQSLADQLASAANDRARFDALLERLKSERKVGELRAIADRYTGYSTAKAKKDDIVRAIRQWHREDEMNRDRRAAQAKTGL